MKYLLVIFLYHPFPEPSQEITIPYVSSFKCEDAKNHFNTNAKFKMSISDGHAICVDKDKYKPRDKNGPEIYSR